jgi:argininosuccinate lyase
MAALSGEEGVFSAASSRRSLTDGRLGTRSSRNLIEHVNRLELDDESVGVEEYVLIDIAHVLMLTAQGIFDEEHGRTLVRALLRLLEDGPAHVLLMDPEVGTLGLQIERYLEETCGPGGLDIQRARSRIDQKATGWRMINRRHLIPVIEELTALGTALLDAAALHDGVLIPGYTHLQHSQPTTLDHYFNAHYWTVSRNLDRLYETFERLNVSPLGGAAYSGTSWPIDRDLTATYLGFREPIANAREAGMAAIDVGAELASTLALTLSGLSRLASDFNYWASSEVDLIHIDASLCGTSSMMPQKRNPMSLERIRGLAGSSAGWAASQLGVMHTSSSTDVDQAYVHNLIPGYCTESAGAIALMNEIVATVDIDIDRMRTSAARHWSTASALADELALCHGMSFRAAHETVARFIAAHERAGHADGVIRVELAEAPLSDYTVQRLQEILDPDSFVGTRISAGGTSAEARASLAAAAATDLARHVAALHALVDNLVTSRGRLLHDAAGLAAAS